MKIHLIVLIVCGLTHRLSAQEILFTSQINNNDNIMYLDEDSQISKITNHSRKDSSPMLSPDGKTMVFTSERVGWWKIWTLDLATRKYKQLTNKSSADYGPSWSPDGKSIIFTSTRDGNQEIYIMNKDGSNKRNISMTNIDEAMPYWADNGYIYFSAASEGSFQLMKCKPDGSERAQITFSSGDKFMPQLSPNGKQLLYYGNENGNMEIYVLNINSETSTRLTNHPLLDMRPRWSPDGGKIVFERGNKGNNHHIFIMKADGKEQKQLTFEHYNYSPTFAKSTFLSVK